MNEMLSHMNIYLLPVIVLIIIYVDVKKSLPHVLSNRFLVTIILQTIFMMATELGGYVPDGMSGWGPRMMVWGMNILYMILGGGVVCTWFLFTYSKLPGGEEALENKKRLFCLIVPLLIYYILLISTPWTHWIMKVNENNAYERGAWYIISYLVMGVYSAGSILLAFRERLRAVQADKKQEYDFLIFFLVFPLAGLFLQSLNLDLWTFWPFTALAILSIYLRIQNGQITTDGLTGLNNRRQLDRYLQMKCGMEKEKNWCLLLMDVDRFKHINDVYGHIEGDRALCRVADVLRKIFGGDDAFLARSGGDEFTVVMSCDSMEEADRTIQNLYKGMEETNRDSEESYLLSLSAGYAFWGGDTADDIYSLMQEADESMYREKQRRYTEGCPTGD